MANAMGNVTPCSDEYDECDFAPAAALTKGDNTGADNIGARHVEPQFAPSGAATTSPADGHALSMPEAV